MTFKLILIINVMIKVYGCMIMVEVIHAFTCCHILHEDNYYIIDKCRLYFFTKNIDLFPHISAHNSHFQLGCQQCSCYAGELLCQERTCMSGSSRDYQRYTGLPCNCGSVYLPVCGSNGKTFPSACIARSVHFNFKLFD